MSRALRIFGSVEGILWLFQIPALFAYIRADAQSVNSFSDQMQLAKAKLLESIRKETSELSGFDEFATVPVKFPIDICLMEVANRLYAACLSVEYYDRRNVTVLSILAHGPPNAENPLFDYELIFKSETRSAQSMDCVSAGTEGFVAVVNDIASIGYNDINDGSPVYQVKNNQVNAVQFFTQPGQVRVQLLSVHNSIFMIQMFRSSTSAAKNLCPILKWIDSTFNVFDHLPCTNAVQIEPFVIEHQIYVAVANHMDHYQNVETHSTIFRYDMNAHKFNQTQKIRTFGAVDVKHFRISNGAINEHFVIFANTFDVHKQKDSAIASNGVVYRYEHGKFVPVQILNFETEIRQLLPVLTENKEYVLLVSMQGEAMKTYQFDGLKFAETSITFSGGAFGRGVSTMRSFRLQKKFAIIVVANVEMYEDAVNLFRPKFTKKMDYDFVKAFDMFDSWHKLTKEKLHSDGIVELFERVERLRPPNGIGVMNLEASAINHIQADTMTGASLSINVRQFKEVVRQANELVGRELLGRRPKRLNESFDANVTDVLSAPAALSANELTISGHLTVKAVNSHPIDGLLRTDVDYLHLDKLVAENLVIAGNADNFKSIEAKLLAAGARSKRQADEVERELGHVTVDGHVNGIKIEHLFENALLKRAAKQRIDADINCGSVSATATTVVANQINGVNFLRFARIAGEHVTVFPPLEFKQDVRANRLEVLERLNQILIRDKRMDILFRRSNKNAQVIAGSKVFQSVELREPIALQGRIKVSSPVLSRMKPLVTIDTDLVIEGAVTLNGNVTVQNVLAASNMFAPSLRFNVDQMQGDGLRVEETVIDAPIEFAQAIRANDILASTNVMDIPIDGLVMRNPNATQVVAGRKTFTTDVSVDGGLAEMNRINGVSLQTLNETMFRISATAQTVAGTVTFRRIAAERINVDKLIVGKASMDQLLTHSTEQVINGIATINGNVLVSNGSALHFDALSTHGRVFDMNLQQLLDDCYSSANNATVQIGADKLFRNVTIDRLVVENDFWHMNASTEEISARVEALQKSITQTGPLVYSNLFHIDDLHVTGAINGIAANVYGSEWLLAAGKQEFTALQHLIDTKFSSNLRASRINGVDVQHIVSQAVLRSSSERLHFNHVVFENVTFEQAIQLEGRLSGIQVPDDLILSQSHALQKFNEPFTLGANMHISGLTTISETLNMRDFNGICALLQPSPADNHRLHIAGNTSFLAEPDVMYLNGELFQRIVSMAWFLDDRSIDLSFATHFENVIWHDAISLTGRLNNIHVEDVGARYLSLSKSQQITAPIKFKGAVHFANFTSVTNVLLDGSLKDFISGATVNVTHFYANVLKHTAEPQFVRAPWAIHGIHSAGNVKTSTLNNLNLNNDVVRWSRPNENVIRAEKSFGVVNIERLYCQFRCSVQGVDVTKWIKTSALNSLDYAIRGRVRLSNAISSHIHVEGPVNGARLDSKSTLLKHMRQRVDGSISVGSPSTAATLMPLTFHDILVGLVNGQNFSGFHANVVARNRRDHISADIFTDVRFAGSLTLDNLTNVWLQNGSHHTNSVQNAQNVFRRSDEPDHDIGDPVRQHFHRLTVRDIYPVNISRIFKIAERNEQIEFLTYYEQNVQLFTWNTKLNLFQRNASVSVTLPPSVIIVDLTVLTVGVIDLIIFHTYNPIDETYSHQFCHYDYDTKQLNRMHDKWQSQWNTLKAFRRSHAPHHCFVLYRPFTPEYEVECVEQQGNDTKSLRFVPVKLAHSKESIIDMSGDYEDLLLLQLSDNAMNSYLFDDEVVAGHYQFGNASSMAVKQFERHGFVCLVSHELSANQSNITVLNLFRIYNHALHELPAIPLPHTPIIQCEFAKLDSDRHILIVATDSEISLFEYNAHLNGFQAIPLHGIRYNAFGPVSFEKSGAPILISLVENQHNLLEFIVVHMSDAMTLIETASDQ